MTHLYLLGDHSEQLLQQKYRKKNYHLSVTNLISENYYKHHSTTHHDSK